MPNSFMSEVDLLCPQCRTVLTVSTDTRRYETLLDHTSDPGGDLPDRPYLFCDNKDCERFRTGFWDDWGDYYGPKGEFFEENSWYDRNNIDPSNHHTFKRIGVEAVNSRSAESRDGMMRERKYFWRRWRSRLRQKWGNKGVELRVVYNPYACDPKTGRKARLLYSLGVWIMDPKGTRWKFYANREFAGSDARARDAESMLLHQWGHHPYPWVRWQVMRFIRREYPGLICETAGISL